MKNYLSTLFTLLAVVVVSMFFSLDSHAASKPSLPITSYHTHVSEGTSFVGSVNCDKKYSIVSVSSSNKTVVPVSISEDKQNYYYSPASKGTATITVKVKVGKKTYKLKEKVTVYDDVIFSSLKYNGKEVYDNLREPVSKYKKGAKVTWKLAPGFKLRSTMYTNTNGQWVVDKNYNYKSFKQNYSPKLGKGQFSWLRFNVTSPSGISYNYDIGVSNY